MYYIVSIRKLLEKREKFKKILSLKLDSGIFYSRLNTEHVFSSDIQLLLSNGKRLYFYYVGGMLFNMMVIRWIECI